MKKRRYDLDTVATIYPSTINKRWSMIFRLSAKLRVEVDPELLQKAVDDLQTRFSFFYVSLQKGFFRYYLEEMDTPVRIRRDGRHKLTYMSRKELKHSCLRVLYGRNHICIELFHGVTDGMGVMVYFVSLLHHYLEMALGVKLNRNELIRLPGSRRLRSDVEDSFIKNEAEKALTLKEDRVYMPHTRYDRLKYSIVTRIAVDRRKLSERAKSLNVSVTELMAALVVESIEALQKKHVAAGKHRPVKISVPYDLRRRFNSTTLRNFCNVCNVGADFRKGPIELGELCNTIKDQLSVINDKEKMAQLFSFYVKIIKSPLYRITPQVLKDVILNAGYTLLGENKGCLSMANLGRFTVPEGMDEWIEDIEVADCALKTCPHNMTFISYGDKTIIFLARAIRDSELEDELRRRIELEVR